MANLRFEWDEAKNLIDQRKHGISFEEATEIFDVPLYMLVEGISEYGEPRWQAFGMTADQLVLMVVHTVEEHNEDAMPTDIIRVISAGRATRKETGPMKTNMVSYTPETLPPITEERRAELRALAERPDYEIDFSDIPELTDEQLKNAVRGRFYRPVKKQVTARLDADVPR